MSVAIKTRNGTKFYATVAERLHAVHESGSKFEVLSSVPMQCGEHWVWTAVIEIDGKRYQGSAQVHLDATPGTPDILDQHILCVCWH